MEIILSSTDHAAVVSDMQNIIPGWHQFRLSPFSGFSFVRLDDEIITPAVYDEAGTETTPAEMSGRLRYWVYNAEDFDTTGTTTLEDTQLQILY